MTNALEEYRDLSPVCEDCDKTVTYLVDLGYTVVCKRCAVAHAVANAETGSDYDERMIEHRQMGI